MGVLLVTGGKGWPELWCWGKAEAHHQALLGRRALPVLANKENQLRYRKMYIAWGEKLLRILASRKISSVKWCRKNWLSACSCYLSTYPLKESLILSPCAFCSKQELVSWPTLSLLHPWNLLLSASHAPQQLTPTCTRYLESKKWCWRRVFREVYFQPHCS